MRSISQMVAALAVVLTAHSALAQVVDPELFGDGKAPVFKMEETDRRFTKTGIYAALSDPPKDPACRRIVATLLVAYADALPYLHRKDQNFYVDPALLQTLNRTILTPDFPATTFLASMIRKTLIDKKVPPAWRVTAETLRAQLNAPIDVSRMQLDAQHITLIDSFSFNMPALLSRYAREVKLATSVAVPQAEDRFRDKYMDRDVAWNGLLLWDVAKELPPEPPKTSKRRRHKKADDAPPPTPAELHTWAITGFPVGRPPPRIPGTAPQRAPEVQVRARLQDNQLVDLSKLVRGQPVLVKGHLWDIGPNMSYVEIRDAYIFTDANWSTWPGLATRADVAECAIAVNDLSPYGYIPKSKRVDPSGNAFQHGP